MAKGRTALPTDVKALVELVHQLVEINERQEKKVEGLTYQVEYLKRQLFGRKSEKIDPDQLQLGFQGEEATTPPPAEEAPPGDLPEEPEKARNGHGRRKAPASLPREKIEYRLDEADRKCCECGSTMNEFGMDSSEQVEFKPQILFIKEHVRYKYACRCDLSTVKMADIPQRPIEKGVAGVGLLAYILVSKFCDHLPLHRLEKMFGRYGFEIPRSTLCDWNKASIDLLEPIYKAGKEEVLESAVINTDDTTTKVQGKQKGTSYTGRFWTYVGDKDHPLILYDFTQNRKKEGPALFLSNYKGYLQADAYSGYDSLFESGEVVEVGCFAHARRKFFDAQSTAALPAGVALSYVQRLYEIETRAKELDPREREDLREAESQPILKEFKEWLDIQATKALPKSPIGDAIGYALNHWRALTRYTTDGRLSIDNNAAERALRSICIGRKNWLFMGNHEGGRRAAIIFSLVESCKRNVRVRSEPS